MNNHFEFTPNEAMKQLIRSTGIEIASASFSTAIVGLAAQIIKNGIFAPKVTRVEIDNSIPTQIYAIGKNDKAKAVYIHSKRPRMNILPSLIMAAFGFTAVYTVKKLTEDDGSVKDTVNV